MMVTDVKKSTPFKICIDDSDCLKIGEGDKFACFQVRNVAKISLTSFFDFKENPRLTNLFTSHIVDQIKPLNIGLK